MIFVTGTERKIREKKPGIFIHNYTLLRYHRLILQGDRLIQIQIFVQDLFYLIFNFGVYDLLVIRTREACIVDLDIILYI